MCQYVIQCRLGNGVASPCLFGPNSLSSFGGNLDIEFTMEPLLKTPGQSF